MVLSGIRYPVYVIPAYATIKLSGSRLIARNFVLSYSRMASASTWLNIRFCRIGITCHVPGQSPRLPLTGVRSPRDAANRAMTDHVSQQGRGVAVYHKSPPVNMYRKGTSGI